MGKRQIVKGIKRIFCIHKWEYNGERLRSCPKCGLIQEGTVFEEYFPVGIFVYHLSNIHWQSI